MRVTSLLAAALVMAACADDASVPTGPDPALSPNLHRGVDRASGRVYTLSNASEGNAVIVFRRGADGTLSWSAEHPTGGLGTGDGLGSQGAIVLADDGRLLFAVNAGSDEISSFRVTSRGLSHVSTVASGGDMPISITSHRDRVYVLNAGGDGNISGFRVRSDGSLSPLSGSTRPLSASGAGPAQVEFTPDGRILVVTEKATNRIVTYLVDRHGRAGAPHATASAGETPFGFSFGGNGELIVSEAFGGAPDASATSSYRVHRDGSVTLISGPVFTTETAACWVAVSGDGRFAYVTNTGSGSVSGYRVTPRGQLELLDADGRTGDTGAGSSPVDAAISGTGQFLYTLNRGNRTISAFSLSHRDGALTALTVTTGLPAGVVGLAAR